MKKEDVFKELKWRGIINNITDSKKIIALARSTRGFGIYVGFDPSFKSLHLGNYVMIRVLKLFAKYGWKTLALVGGATGMIGDPSGKSAERNLLDNQIVKTNVKAIGAQLQKYAQPNIIFNNETIWAKMSVINYLRDLGKFFQVNRMLEKDIVKSRLKSGISYSEFSYSLLQSYDWIYLYQNFNIAIQCGGSDQWGNITAGVDFFRKIYNEQHSAAGLTINLLLKKDGKKFGKSESGAIYLDPKITSPYLMYQFLLNQADADLEKLFNFFSDFNQSEIKTILKQHHINPKSRLGQLELAKALVSDIHGSKEFLRCQKISKLFFEQKYEKLKLAEINELFNQDQKVKAKLIASNLVDQLANFNLFQSKREIREFLAQNAIRINGKIYQDENLKLTRKDALFNKYFIIKKGKKTFFLVGI